MKRREATKEQPLHTLYALVAGFPITLYVLHAFRESNLAQI